MRCDSCLYWKKWDFRNQPRHRDTDWGDCLYEPVKITKPANDYCHKFKDKNEDAR